MNGSIYLIDQYVILVHAMSNKSSSSPLARLIAVGLMLMDTGVIVIDAIACNMQVRLYVPSRYYCTSTVVISENKKL